MAANQGGRSKDNKAAKMTKEEREKKMAEMKKSREDYDAQLKKIMTKEQYDSYVKKQAEREKQMKEGRQNRQKDKGNIDCNEWMYFLSEEELRRYY